MPPAASNVTRNARKIWPYQLMPSAIELIDGSVELVDSVVYLNI